MLTRSWQGRSALLAAAVALLALNTAYLAAFASASLFYFANVVLHFTLGLALAAVFGGRLLHCWRRVSWLVLVAALLLALGTVFGVLMLFLGAAGRYRWLLPVHIGLSLA